MVVVEVLVDVVVDVVGDNVVHDVEDQLPGTVHDDALFTLTPTVYVVPDDRPKANAVVAGFVVNPQLEEPKEFPGGHHSIL